MIIDKIKEIGIVPVVKINNMEDALPLAKALYNGGIPVAEITFRTEIAAEAMKLITSEMPQMIIGAGTVLTVEQVDKAILSGAKFIVSPGLNSKIVKYCQQREIPIIPGCANASDIELALELGLNAVKFFPAEQLGGLKMIDALSAPYASMNFMPTGGINEKNISSYIKNDKIIACGGTWMIDKNALKNKDFDKITELTKEALISMLNLKLKHVGINVIDGTAKEVALKFADLFGSKVIETNKGFFGSSNVEVFTNKMGHHGHIAISTNSVLRAKRYFEFLNFEFDEDTKEYDKNGILKLIYMKDEIGGFKVHLINE